MKSKQPHGPSMMLGNMRELGVRGINVRVLDLTAFTNADSQGALALVDS